MPVRKSTETESHTPDDSWIFGWTFHPITCNLTKIFHLSYVFRNLISPHRPVKSRFRQRWMAIVTISLRPPWYSTGAQFRRFTSGSCNALLLACVDDLSTDMIWKYCPYFFHGFDSKTLEPALPFRRQRIPTAAVFDSAGIYSRFQSHFQMNLRIGFWLLQSLCALLCSEFSHNFTSWIYFATE